MRGLACIGAAGVELEPRCSALHAPIPKSDPVNRVAITKRRDNQRNDDFETVDMISLTADGLTETYFPGLFACARVRSRRRGEGRAAGSSIPGRQLPDSKMVT